MVAAAAFGGLLTVPISAANASVTGSLSYLERVALTRESVAIVTIVDQTAAPDAGASDEIATPTEPTPDDTPPADADAAPADPTTQP